MLLSAMIWGQSTPHSLDAICARLGITIPEQARHTAMGDAEATAQAFLRMIPALEAKGITYLGSFHNGFRQLTNSKHSVTKPEDLKDLKIRVPGSAVYMGVFNALGASPTAMSWSEVFTAIQQKTIDGQENGCSVTKSAKMDEIQQYMTIWNYSYENDLFVANSRVWESLDENTRQLLQECATESCEWGRDHLEAEEDQLIQGFMDSGMQVDILTEDQLQAFKDAVAGVTADLKAEYGEDACAAFGIN